MSFTCSTTCLRNRANSMRSAGVNGSSLRAAAASTRRRSSATHCPSRPSLRPSSRATSAIVRPGIDHPMSSLDLVLSRKRPRVRDMVTSFQRDHPSRYLDVHHSGGTARLPNGTAMRMCNALAMHRAIAAIGACGPAAGPDRARATRKLVVNELKPVPAALRVL
jgi:hypothetical protein